MHLLPDAIRSTVKLEALPNRPFTAHLGLDVGDFTLAVTTESGPLIERVQVTPGAPDRPDVTVRGSILEVLWVRRGDTTRAETGLTIEGAPRHVAAVTQLFGLGDPTEQ